MLVAPENYVGKSLKEVSMPGPPSEILIQFSRVELGIGSF